MHLKTLAIIFYCALTLAPVLAFCHDRDTSKTEIYIIGVIHKHKPFRNADSMLVILNNIKPDLILAEMDTLTWMFNADYSLVVPIGWENENQKLEFRKGIAPEDKATYLYAKKNQTVKVHPFDMTITNRKEYVVFLSGNKWQHALKKTHRKGLLTNELDSAYHSYFSSHKQYKILRNLSYSQLNRASLVDSFRIIMNTENRAKLSLVEHVAVSPAKKNWLRRMITMDIERDKVMVENIIQFIGKTNARKVVVLTGFLHKPFLIDGLTAVSAQNNYTLIEYFDR